MNIRTTRPSEALVHSVFLTTPRNVELGRAGRWPSPRRSARASPSEVRRDPLWNQDGSTALLVEVPDLLDLGEWDRVDVDPQPATSQEVQHLVELAGQHLV